MFAVLENMATFVVRQTCKVGFQSNGHTYSADTAGLILWRIFWQSIDTGLSQDRERLRPFSFITYCIFRPMRQASKNLTATGNNSTRMSTANARNSVSDTKIPLKVRRELSALKRKFEVEKDAKNKVYAYILSCGHLDQYVKYRRATKGMDTLLLCQGAIAHELIQSKIKKIK